MQRTMLACGALALLAARAASADDARVEPWIAVGASLSAPAGGVTTAYAPRLDDVPQGGTAGQTLTLDPTHGPTLEAGVAFFPFASPRVGFQVFGSYDRSDLGGANTPYSAHFLYIAGQPPDLVPRQYPVDQTVAWPDTVGTLKRFGLGSDLVLRFGTGRLDGRVFAGLAWTRVSGEAESLGYTAYNLGGHLVLFSNEAHLAFALESTHAVGAHLGAQGELALGAHAAVLVGARYFRAGDRDLPVRIDRIVNGDQLLRTLTVAGIAADLGPLSARLPVRALQVVVGVQLRP